jgi:glycosyltransferase involved in cell wall biosynthesis
MVNNPKISVLMTVFNGERFIKEAIDSILNQALTNFEFIIVDNASTDGTKKIISSYNDPRIVLIENEENLGQTKALNIGIKRSKGEFIARMDADDISMPQRLESQYKYLSKNESIAIVGSWHEEIDIAGRHIRYFRMPLDPIEIKYYLISPGELGYYCVSHSTVLMRRNILFKVGLYNDNYCTQDYELWVRIARRYNLANLNQYLLKHRITTTQQTKQFKDEIESDCEKIIKSNIRYYLPSIGEEELMSLVRMLQYKPQKSKEDGLKVLEIFTHFFEKYMDGDENSLLAKKARNKMLLFYLLQLFKTNPTYSLKELL